MLNITVITLTFSFLQAGETRPTIFKTFFTLSRNVFMSTGDYDRKKFKSSTLFFTTLHCNLE